MTVLPHPPPPLTPNKACAVVLRRQGQRLEILAFRHPTAGCQLVKGTIEVDEQPSATAVRELFEEAGLRGAWEMQDLGIWDADYKGQVWSLHLLGVDRPPPDTWDHFAEDDGGHLFSFFWQPLDAAATDEWRPVYARALRHVAALALGLAVR